MSKRRSGMVLALVSAALVCVLVFLDLERTSPGELARVHSDLDGGRDCDECHAAGGGGALTCGTCHAEVEAQVATGRGFHGQLEEGARCGRCHAEHHGAGHELAGEHAFALAGFEPRASYDHRGLALALEGRHDELECAECHEHADVEPLAEGQRRFLGLDGECASCHEDPHEGRMARGCATCHGQSGPFEELASFVHTPEFPLRGPHGGLECARCHEPGSRWSVEAEAAHEPPPPRGCLACHESPHAAPFVAGVAAFLEVSEARSCEACHAAEAESFALGGEAMRPDLHAAGGFALEEPHDALACDACHSGDGEFDARYPGRAANDCAACHEDPHGGQFRPAPRAATRCLDCHLPHAFEPPAFGAAEHAGTAFALEGEHLDADCHACHSKPAEKSPRVFRGTPRACASCHADAHALARGGAFAALEESGLRTASDCGECHVPTRFADVEREAFDHARWAGFALDGAHARAGCETCHAPSRAADELGRRFGRVAELFGEPVERCSTCHADVHLGRFDEPGRPRVVDGAEGCARCHTTEAFGALDVRSFDHGRWTGHALEGAHASAPCASCHAELAEPAEHGRSYARAAQPAERCTTCHADPHAGRFDGLGVPALVDGAEGCARCHTTHSFRVVSERFDHGLWTGFALEDAHARAACSDCHPRGLRRGEPALGAPPGKRCADCHADPHAGQFRAGDSTDCARCHQSAASFAELAFDHDRDARFALDAKHEKLACSACHVPWPLESGGEVVRYRPLGTECADCHAPSGGGR